MTAAEFRRTQAWRKVARLMREGATHCALCGEPLRFDTGHMHPLAPAVDHVRELATLDLDTAAGRADALDPRNLRVTHVSCNASRGAEFGLRLRRGDAGVRDRRTPEQHDADRHMPHPNAWLPAADTRLRWSAHWYGPRDAECPGPCAECLGVAA